MEVRESEFDHVVSLLQEGEGVGMPKMETRVTHRHPGLLPMDSGPEAADQTIACHPGLEEERMRTIETGQHQGIPMDGAFQEPVITGLGHERARRPAINILLEDAKRLIGVRCRRAEVDMPVAGYVRRGRKLARKALAGRGPGREGNGVVGSLQVVVPMAGEERVIVEDATEFRVVQGHSDVQGILPDLNVPDGDAFLAIEDRNDPPITVIIHLEQEREVLLTEIEHHAPHAGPGAGGRPVRSGTTTSPDQAQGRDQQDRPNDEQGSHPCKISASGEGVWRNRGLYWDHTSNRIPCASGSSVP